MTGDRTTTDSSVGIGPLADEPKTPVAAAREYLAYADEGLNRVDPWIGVRHLRNILAAPDPLPVSREAVFDLVQDAILAVVSGQETTGSAAARVADALTGATSRE